MSTEEKRRRLRRLVPSWSFLTRLRRPYLFRLAGKDRGEKGRWVTFGACCILNSGGTQCFSLAFHSVVTLRGFDYAPPDTGVSNLQLVAVERLPSIERAAEILIDLTFLRLTERWMQICCNLSVSASPSHLPFQGRLWTACGLFYPAEACFFPDLFLAARPARLMMAARAATRAQPTRPETEVPAALSLPAKL